MTALVDRSATTRFRAALAVMPTGVTVVTTPAAGGVRGMTASSVASLSLRPPLLLVCLNVRSQTLAAVTDTRRFGVSVLTLEDQDLADRCATAGRGPLPADTCVTMAGVPVLRSALAWTACTVHDIMHGGDHRIVIGAVIAVGHRDGEPLVRQRSRYRRLA